MHRSKHPGGDTGRSERHRGARSAAARAPGSEARSAEGAASGSRARSRVRCAEGAGSPSRRAAAGPTGPRRAPSATILVVEDHDDTRDALAEILAIRGYSVATARNGLEALGVLRGGPRPDLIILDLMMPVMDGREFLRRKETLPERLARIPVVVFSAHPTPVAGVWASLYKTEVDRLLEVVDRRPCPPA